MLPTPMSPTWSPTSGAVLEVPHKSSGPIGDERARRRTGRDRVPGAAGRPGHSVVNLWILRHARAGGRRGDKQPDESATCRVKPMRIGHFTLATPMIVGALLGACAVASGDEFIEQRLQDGRVAFQQRKF